MQKALETSPSSGIPPQQDNNNTLSSLCTFFNTDLRKDDGLAISQRDTKQAVEDDNGKSTADGCPTRKEASETFKVRPSNLFDGKVRQCLTVGTISPRMDHIVSPWRRATYEDKGDEADQCEDVKGVCPSAGFQVRPNRQAHGLQSFSISKHFNASSEPHHQEADPLIPHYRFHESSSSGVLAPLIQKRKHGLHVEGSQGAGKEDLPVIASRSEGRSDPCSSLFEPSSLRHVREPSTTKTQPHDVNESLQIVEVASPPQYVIRSKEEILKGKNFSVCINSNCLDSAKRSMLNILEVLGDPFQSEISDNVHITIVPGGSDSTPTFLLFNEFNNKSRLMRPRALCTHPLASIAKGGLNIDKVIRHLISTGEDSILLYLIRKFITASIDFDFTEDQSESFEDEVSPRTNTFYNFTDEDFYVLFNADLIIHAQPSTNSNPGFKVAKKDHTGRFIIDCRGLNMKHKSEGKVCTMDIDPLEDVIRAAERFHICISTDADAYFFQFRLSNKASKRFPVHLGTIRGKVHHFQFRALPMGFTLAPAIAQRTSNIIIRAVRRWMAKEDISGAVFAWIDNYLVFADDLQTAEKVMDQMRFWLNYFEIKHKPIDYSGEFLGMRASEKGVALSEKFVAKTEKAIVSFHKIHSPTFNDFLIVAGHAIWANTTVIRRPLCMFPHTLTAIRRASEDLEAKIANPLLADVLHEMSVWRNHLRHISKRTIIDDQQTERAWSDATPKHAAFVIEHRDHDFVAQARFIPSLRPENIFLAELIAAAWACLSTNNFVDNFIDNTAVAYALAKGHSTAQTANNLLRLIYDHKRPRKVFHISTHEQRADGPTRDREPAPRKDQYHSALALPSFFTA